MAYSQRAALLTPITPSMPVCPAVTEHIDSLPITPPDIVDGFDDKTFKPDSRIIQRALHVLATERTALGHLEDLYINSPDAQVAMIGAVRQIIHSETHHGKVIFTGIGKSGHIATKLSATFNSLGIQAACLHPSEALHGDLGLIRPNDTIIMITFSGRTPELLTLVSHIAPAIPLIIMTSHTNPHTCPLLTHPNRASSTNILLPTILHESETVSFGISAPTTSTTITLALGDSLALTVAEALHTSSGLETPTVFAANHPGGAIGASFSSSSNNLSSSSSVPPPPSTPTISTLSTPLSTIPTIAAPHPSRCLRVLDVLLTAARSPSGFVRTTPNHMIAPRRIQSFDDPSLLVDVLFDDAGPVVIERTDWISILGSTSITEAKEWIWKMRNEGDGRGRKFLRRGTILGVVEGNEVTGVVEIERVVGGEVDLDLD